MGRRQQLINLFRDISGLSAVRWSARKPGLYCFNYHRLGAPETNQFDPNAISCTPERFEQHVAFYKQNFTVINVEQLLALQDTQATLDKPMAVITFDDGYEDNYHHAFPILKKYQLSAIFFISTQHIGTDKLFWWDQIAWMLRHSENTIITLPHAKPVDLSALPIKTAIHLVLKAIKRDSTTSIEHKLAQLAEQTRCHNPLPKTGLTMSWKMLKEMHASGMDIGSHTCSHRILSHLSEQDQQVELSTSKQQLEAQLGAPINAFAYPVGGMDTYTQATQRLLHETGYRVAFNYIGYTNADLQRPFELGRLPIDENISVMDLKRQIAFSPMRGEA